MDMRDLINVVAEAQKLDELRGLRAQRGKGFTSRADVLDFLEREGLELLGKPGSYGAVFDHPSFGGRYVLKIFADPFYEQFLNNCIDMGGNPHLPKVFGRVMKLTEEGRMVRIERLTDVDEGTFRRLRINKLALAAMNFEDLSDQTRSNVLAFADRNGLTEFFQVLVDIARAAPPRSIVDFDAQNFMMRGPTMVIADPYAGGKIPFLR